jgi:hypothetical protein
MPVEIDAIIFSVESNKGKDNVIHTNIVLQNLKARKQITYYTNDAELAAQFKLLEGHTVNLVVGLNESKFGLRLGDVLSMTDMGDAA